MLSGPEAQGLIAAAARARCGRRPGGALEERRHRSRPDLRAPGRRLRIRSIVEPTLSVRSACGPRCDHTPSNRLASELRL